VRAHNAARNGAPRHCGHDSTDTFARHAESTTISCRWHSPLRARVHAVAGRVAEMSWLDSLSLRVLDPYDAAALTQNRHLASRAPDFLQSPLEQAESWYHFAMKYQDPRVKVRDYTTLPQSHAPELPRPVAARPRTARPTRTARRERSEYTALPATVPSKHAISVEQHFSIAVCCP
jgi:hypothetical protein